MRRLIAALLLVVLLPLAMALVLAVAVDPIIDQYRQEAATQVGNALGRQVRFGPVRLDYKDGLGVLLTNVELEGRTPGGPAQVSLASLFVRFDAWKALKTRGRHVEASSALVTGVVVRLARDPHGQWDVADIQGHLREQALAAAPANEEEASRLLQGLRIAGLTLEDGRVEIVDSLLGRTLVVDKLHLELSTIVAGQDVSALLECTLDDGVARAPLSLAATMRPLPARLDVDNLPALDLHLTLKDLELGSWSALLPERWIKPVAGRLGLDVKTLSHAGGVQGSVVGNVAVAGLVLAQDGQPGGRTDVRMAVDADANLTTGHFEVRNVELHGAGVDLASHASVTGKHISGIKNVLVDLKVADLAQVMAVVPPASRVVPQELTLVGPFALHLEGDPDEAEFSVDLDKARLAWGKDVDKQPGIPLQFKVVATRAEGRVQFQPFVFVVADARVAGWLDVPEDLDGPMEGALYSGDINLADVRSIFPVVARAEKKEGMRLDGLVQVSAVASSQEHSQALDLAVRLRRMDVKLPSTVLHGNADLTAKLAPHDASSSTMEAHANLTHLAFQHRDTQGQRLVDKRQGVPVRLDVRALRSLDRVDLEQAELQLGKTEVAVLGHVRGLASHAPHVEVGIQELNLAFDDVREVAPSLHMIPPGTRLTAGFVVEGDVLEPSSLVLDAWRFKLSCARSTIWGDVTLSNPLNPHVDAHVQQIYLDLAELRRLTNNRDVPDQGTLHTQFFLKGTLRQPETMEMVARGMDVHVFDSRVQGDAEVHNLQEPVMDVRLKVDRIHVDDLQRRLGLDPSVEATPQGPPVHGLTPEVRTALARLSGNVELEVGELTARRYRASNVGARLLLDHGVFTCEHLDLATYQGLVSLGGSRVDTTGEWLHTRLVLGAKGLDVGSIYDAHASDRDRISGNVDVDVDLAASGMNLEDVQQSLEGPVALSSAELTIQDVDLLSEVLQRAPPTLRPLLAPLRNGGRAATTLEDLQGQAMVHAGRVSSTQPLRARTSLGLLQLEGSAGMDSSLALVGTASLQPALIMELTGGRVEPPRPVVLPIQLGGTWNAPELESVDYRTLAGSLGLPEGVAMVMHRVQEFIRPSKRKPAAPKGKTPAPPAPKP